MGEPLQSLPRTNNPAVDLQRYRTYLRQLTRLQLNSRFASKFDASDVVQECLLDAQRSVGEFRGHTEEQVRAWLRTILKHQLANSIRDYLAQKRDVRREIAAKLDPDQSAILINRLLAADQTSPSLAVQRAEQLQQLHAALAQLPADQYQTVILKHLHGKSLLEVATIMDRSVAATGGLLKRGMHRLRQLMSAAMEAENAAEQAE